MGFGKKSRAQRDKKKVHLATLMDICHFKKCGVRNNFSEVQRTSRAPRLSFSNKLMLNDWIWRTHITDMLNLDENKFDCKKNWS